MSIFREMDLSTVNWDKVTIGDFDNFDPSNKKEVAALNMYQQYKADKRNGRRTHSKKIRDHPPVNPNRVLEQLDRYLEQKYDVPANRSAKKEKKPKTRRHSEPINNLQPRSIFSPQKPPPGNSKLFPLTKVALLL